MKIKTGANIAEESHITSGYYFSLDRRMKLIFISPNCRELFRRDPQELIGKDVTEIFPGLNQTRFASVCARILGSQLPEVVEGDFLEGHEPTVWHFYPLEDGLFVVWNNTKDGTPSSNDLLRQGLQFLPAAICLIDQVSGEIVYANCKEFCGYNLPDLIPVNPLAAAVDAEDRPSFEDHWARFLSGQSPASIDFRLVDGEGSRRWIRIHIQTVTRSPSGAPHYIIATFTDINREKLAMEAFRQDGEKFRQLIENSSDVFYLVGLGNGSADGRVEYISPQVEELSGYRAEAFYNTPALFRQLIHEEDIPALDQATRKLLEEKASVSREYRLWNTCKKQYVWIFDRLTPRFDHEGNLIGYQGVAKDDTERKLAEQALLEREASLKEAQAIGKVGSWKYHLASESVSWSDEMYRLYERDPSQGPPSMEEEEEYYSSEQALILREYTRLVIREGCDVQFDLEITLPSGREANFFVKMRPEKDELGRVVNIHGTVQDITERKRAEKEIKQRLDELETVNRISVVLNQARSLNEMLPNFLDEILALLKSDTGAIFLTDENDSRLIRAAEYGWNKLTKKSILSVIDEMVGTAFTTGEIQISSQDGGQAAAVNRKLFLPDGRRRYLCAPIRAENRMVGVIFAISPAPLSKNDLRLLATVAEISGNAILRARFHEQTLRQMQRLTVLHEIDQAINSTMDLDTLLFVLLSQITGQLHVDAADILLYDQREKKLELITGIGFRSRDSFNYHEGIENDLIGQAFRKKWIVYEPDVTLPEAVISKRIQRLQGEDFKAHIVAPIIIKGEIRAVLELFHRTRFDPDPDWLNFLDTLVGQTAVAMDSAMMFADLLRTNKQLSEAYDATIEGWATALDLRDKETKNHAKRVAEITVRLARQLGIDDEQLVHYRRGALLHDIGKLSVPDHILFKASNLTAEEQEIMRRHPQQAYEMLYPIEHLRPAIDIPYCHHEKWDGTGYPRGLKGEEIPLAARIFAVADVFDALTSERSYRKAWPYAQALNWIYEQSGKHFDPKVVSVFLSMFHTGRLSALP